MVLKILVVDGNAMARDAIKAAIGRCRLGPPEVISETADGASALALVRRLRPDIVTLDINLPDMNGLELTRTLSEEMPGMKVIVVTINDDRQYRRAVIDAGADSLIGKQKVAEELPELLDQLAAALPSAQMSFLALDNIQE